MTEIQENKRTVRFEASDGYQITGTFYDAETPKAAVLISGGAAIPQRFYRHIADYLTRRGLAVLTYDYRGIGESAPKDLRNFDAPMHIWGTHDQAAAIAWLDRQYPDLDMLHLAHSYGGQALGMTERSQRFRRSVMIASQSGYWRRFIAPERYRVFLAMNLFAPVVASFKGYLPGNLSGFGEDMAWSTFKQWAYWCRQKNYLFDDPRIDTSNYGNLAIPILSVGIDDDDWAPPNAIDALVSNYTGAAVERRQIAPRDAGVPKIGHFGFFRPELEEALWGETIDWLVQDL